MAERDETSHDKITAAAPAPEATPVKAETAAAAPSENSKIPSSTAEAAPALPTAQPEGPPPAEGKAGPGSEIPAAPVAATPPPFLREHATRIIAKPQARSDGKTSRKAAPAAKEKAPQSRFALLAASVALAACLGGALGSIGVASLSRVSGAADTATPRADALAEVQALKELIAQLGAEVAATKTNVDHLGKVTGTQFGKIIDRFDRADRVQADPPAKLVKIAEALDRLERRVAAIPTPPPAVASAPAAPANDVTGTVTPRPAPETKAPPKPAILEGWVLRRAYDGVALIEGRMGVIEVEPGAPLPGGGRVEEIKRQDGHWVVVTSKGLIVPSQYR